MKKLLVAMAIGAGLAWLFDPDNGARRREVVRQKLDQRGASSPSPAAQPALVEDAPTLLTASQ